MQSTWCSNLASLMKKQTLLQFQRVGPSMLGHSQASSASSPDLSSSLTSTDEGDDQDDETEETEDTTCLSECCNPNRQKPNQPVSSNILACTKRYQGQGKSRQARFVQASWFDHYPWLSLCETRYRLFCFYCSNAENRKMMTFSTKGDATFSRLGFTNWKKATERFKRHESSQAHSEAFMKVTSEVNLACMLDAAHKDLQLTRQRMLLKQLSSLKYLLRQGLAIRGHSEMEGNLRMIMN